MSLWGRLRGTLALWKDGPARLESVERAVRQLAEAQSQLGTQLGDRHAEHAQLVHSVMAKAADADLQYVRNTLAADLKRETGWLRDRLSALTAAVDRAGSNASHAGAAPTTPSHSAAEEAFYPALEQQFRGTREELLARLQAYQDWIGRAPAGRVADLGCGRGEWLELLATWGRDAVGVDMNSVLVAQNIERGLNAVESDAVSWLAAQPESSLAAITCFHVVEHLPLGVLLALVDTARRALAPGGLLVLETPNPENLGVATHSFWLDPTHQRPLPPALLEFIVVHGGLAHEATLRLNPPTEEAGTQDPALRQLMMVGRDYAVIGRKPAA